MYTYGVSLLLCCQALYQAIHSLQSNVAHTGVEESSPAMVYK